ncbi:MAG: hypothetical protein J6X67_09425 [Treponema sp.]|nr:hypothetical protein [Treponema sp.]
METKETFKILLDQYFSRITYTNDCFELYKHLIDSKRKYLAEMNFAPAFFQLTYSSLLHTVFIETAKLFDDKSQTSLFKLINICRENVSLFKTTRDIGYVDCDTDKYVLEKTISIDFNKELADCRQLLKNVSRERENLRNQRNKYYAHLDEAYKDNNGKLEKDFPLSFKDMKKFLQIASEVCNKISVMFDESIYAVQTNNVFDVDNLFKKLSKDGSK